jgi:uncharacterized membrane protein
LIKQGGDCLLKYIAKFLILWFLMGMCYAQLELFARGFTYLPMTFIGGLAGALIGLVNHLPAAPRLRMWQLCLIGTLIVLDVEFISGYICNIRLGMMLWDYSGYRYNLNGQICLKLACAWFFIVPLATWMDNFLRWKLFNELQPASLLQSYVRLFTFH